MTEDEKDEAVSGAVKDCLDRAANILETNRDDSVRALFSFYVDSEGTTVHSVGHTMGLEAAYHKALKYIINDLIQPLEPDEGR